MLESPAYRALTVSAHRVISRVEIELANHAGHDNGQLPITTEDFMTYNLDRASVAPAIREAEALGFIRVTRRGRAGNAEHRAPNLFFLTFGIRRGPGAPTDEWKKIKTLEEAYELASVARLNKNRSAVAQGIRRAADRKMKQNLGMEKSSASVLDNHTETPPSAVGHSRTTAAGEKPILLSISREREAPEAKHLLHAVGPKR